MPISNGQVPNTSILQLIANPQKFDKKTVRFQGVVNIEFERNGIYLSKEHWENSVTSCGIWLDIDPKLAKSRKWANGKYFIIEGVFHAEDKGHMGLWMGSISNITLLQVHEVVTPQK